MTELERIKEEADKAFAEKQTETTSTENETNVSENSVENKDDFMLKIPLFKSLNQLNLVIF